MSKLPPLSAAVADLNLAEAAKMVAADARSVDELSWEGLTPLHWACTGSGSAQLCELLLSASRSRRRSRFAPASKL